MAHYAHPFSVHLTWYTVLPFIAPKWREKNNATAGLLKMVIKNYDDISNERKINKFQFIQNIIKIKKLSEDATIIKLIRMDYLFTVMSPWLRWKHNIWVDIAKILWDLNCQKLLLNSEHKFTKSNFVVKQTHNLLRSHRKYLISFIYVKIKNLPLLAVAWWSSETPFRVRFGTTVKFYRWLHDASNQIKNNQTKQLINFCRMSFIYGSRILSTKRW